MKLTQEEIRARLDAAPACDVCVLRIEDGDYGCEEPKDEPLLWVQAVDRAGETYTMELPESRVDVLHLAEGSVCRLAELKNH